jgi:hypothetical protein
VGGVDRAGEAVKKDQYDADENAQDSYDLAIATLRQLKTAAERELREEAAEQEKQRDTE